MIQQDAARAAGASLTMLTFATLGLAGYGVYSAAYGIVDLIGSQRLEISIDIALVALGVLLVVAAALIRVSFPGGLPLATGSVLAIQAFAIHNAAHLYGVVALAPQLARGALAATLLLLAIAGSRRAKDGPH